MRATFLRDFGVLSEISEDLSRARYTVARIHFRYCDESLLLSLEYSLRCPLARFLLTYCPHKAIAITAVPDSGTDFNSDYSDFNSDWRI
jgi:hypothetical protein